MSIRFAMTEWFSQWCTTSPELESAIERRRYVSASVSLARLAYIGFAYNIHCFMLFRYFLRQCSGGHDDLAPPFVSKGSRGCLLCIVSKQSDFKYHGWIVNPSCIELMTCRVQCWWSIFPDNHTEAFFYVGPASFNFFSASFMERTPR